MRVLVVDDDRDSLEAVAGFLADPLGFEVVQAQSCSQALELYRSDPFPIVISDIRMKGMNGIEFLKEIRKLPEGAGTDMVLMTGFGELESSIEALRAGAADYILKPIYVRQLDEVIKRILEKRELQSALKEARHQVKQETKAKHIISEELDNYRQIFSHLIEGEKIGIFSEKTKAIVDLSLKLHDDRDIPVLIEGETGTGKEVIAQLVHRGQGQCTRPFVTLNCSAISPTLFESELFGYEKGAFTGARMEGAKGKLELAQGGTLFLDEIGDMPLEMQPKLLRAIQQKEIYRLGGSSPLSLDVRIICATNRVLAEMVEENKFRPDLYYRINSGRIFLPPLKDRRAEIAPLARMFLDQLNQQKNKSFKFIDRDAVHLLESYDWPGNIRELKNTIDRVCLLFHEEIIKVEHLGFLNASTPPVALKQLVLDLNRKQYPLEEIKQQVALKVYHMFNKNISKAAEYLNVAWATFVKMAGLK